MLLVKDFRHEDVRFSVYHHAGMWYVVRVSPEKIELSFPYTTRGEMISKYFLPREIPDWLCGGID